MLPVKLEKRSRELVPWNRVKTCRSKEKRFRCVAGLAVHCELPRYERKMTNSFRFCSPTSTRSPVLEEDPEVDQDLILPANVPSANGPAVPPIVPETTQATTTSTFAPWRTSRRTTGKLLECLNTFLQR